MIIGREGHVSLKARGLLSSRYRGLHDVTFYRGKGCNQCEIGRAHV